MRRPNEQWYLGGAYAGFPGREKYAAACAARAAGRPFEARRLLEAAFDEGNPVAGFELFDAVKHEALGFCSAVCTVDQARKYLDPTFGPSSVLLGNGHLDDIIARGIYDHGLLDSVYEAARDTNWMQAYYLYAWCYRSRRGDLDPTVIRHLLELPAAAGIPGALIWMHRTGDSSPRVSTLGHSLIIMEMVSHAVKGGSHELVMQLLRLHRDGFIPLAVLAASGVLDGRRINLINNRSDKLVQFYGVECVQPSMQTVGFYVFAHTLKKVRDAQVVLLGLCRRKQRRDSLMALLPYDVCRQHIVCSAAMRAEDPSVWLCNATERRAFDYRPFKLRPHWDATAFPTTVGVIRERIEKDSGNDVIITKVKTYKGDVVYQNQGCCYKLQCECRYCDQLDRPFPAEFVPPGETEICFKVEGIYVVGV